MLAAYIIAQDQDRPTTTSLQNHLRQTLPQYMIPSAFVFLEAFPQTPNRKIDRRALPSPNKFRPDLDNRFVAPRDDLEKVLASILADLLGLEEVGIHDDFFELGGHSLQATRYVSRVSQALRTELSLWLFLQAPNVADFAAALSRSADDDRIKRIAQLRVKMAAMSPDEMQQLQDKFKDRKFGE
jgi:acyl carrier protein